MATLHLTIACSKAGWGQAETRTALQWKPFIVGPGVSVQTQLETANELERNLHLHKDAKLRAQMLNPKQVLLTVEG